SQQNIAAGDPVVTNTAQSSNTTLNTELGTGAGSGSVPTGIYFPHTLALPTGGIYVKGNLDHCTLSVDGSGNQVYTLIQGGSTCTITLNHTANTTTIVGGADPGIYTGLPRGVLYCDG